MSLADVSNLIEEPISVTECNDQVSNRDGWMDDGLDEDVMDDVVEAEQIEDEETVDQVSNSNDDGLDVKEETVEAEDVEDDDTVKTEDDENNNRTDEVEDGLRDADDVVNEDFNDKKGVIDDAGVEGDVEDNVLSADSDGDESDTEILPKVAETSWKTELYYCSLLLVLLLIASLILSLIFLNYIADFIAQVQQNFNYYYDYYLWLYGYTLFYFICKLIFVPEVLFFSE